MKLEEYKEIVKNNSVKDDKFKNACISFFTGGIIGVFSELLFLLFNNIFNFNNTDSYTLVTIIFVIVASILTGLCVFDKVSSYLKAGILIPITGFAHAMTSSAMDNKDEGLVFGVGSNIFKLTGIVILYGIISSIIFALIKGLIL